jgi:hypothetical protein
VVFVSVSVVMIFYVCVLCERDKCVCENEREGEGAREAGDEKKK